MSVLRILRVRNWEKHFENNRSRELKNMTWVPVPNKHDGDGYTDLMSRPDSMSLFGGWMLILQVASRCDPRGTLLREGGKPHDSVSISRITRGNEEIIRKSIETCLDIGWLEYNSIENNTVTKTPQEGAALPQEGAAIPQEGAQNGMEWNGMEEKGKQHKSPSAPKRVSKRSSGVESFDRFWSAYPRTRRSGKPKCLKIWEKKNLDAKADEILSALEQWKFCELWTKDGGSFVMGPERWLNEENWESPPEQSAADAALAASIGMVPDHLLDEDEERRLWQDAPPEGVPNGGF